MFFLVTGGKSGVARHYTSCHIQENTLEDDGVELSECELLAKVEEETQIFIPTPLNTKDIDGFDGTE